MTSTVVLLHGFAGTRRGWEAVCATHPDRAEPYSARALDLRGHGAARAARPISFDACAADVLAAAPPRFVLAGYSMGARIALYVALAAPGRIARLVLVSATAGIEDACERARRRAADEVLAAFAEHATIEAFADRWLAQPLFARDPPAVGAFARQDILRNDPRALAAVLRGIGTGTMVPLWGRLAELPMPAAVLAGERDPKYVALGERLVAALPDARLTVVPGAGHGLPREAPQAVAEAVVG